MNLIILFLLFCGTIWGHEPIRINVNLNDHESLHQRIHLNPTMDLPPLFINFTNSVVSSPPEPENLQEPPLIPISEFMHIPPNPNPALEYRRQFLINMTKEAWSTYVNSSWGQAELHPVSLPNNTEPGNGKSIFAAMSTLWVMGLTEEFTNATDWIDREMNSTKVVEDQLWEVPGALLSLYALTGNGFFLQKARNVADRFEVTDNNLWGYSRIWTSQRLEYRYLTDLTGTLKYMEQVQKIEKILNASDDHKQKLQQSTGNSLMLLVKAYFQTAGIYSKSLKTKFYDILEFLESSNYLTSAPEVGLAFIKLTADRPFMYTWHCIFGAMLALGAEILPEVMKAKTGWSTVDEIQNLKLLKKAEHLFDLAKNLTETCHLVSNTTASGLPFGQFKINENAAKENRKLVIGAGGYWLWSQIAETYFVLYRMTLNRKYQEYAWELAQAIYKHSRIPTGGYAEVQRVDKIPVEKYLDTQPAEFLSGTLKYLYLTFAPERFMPLDQWVFNAHGHPLPICGKNWAYPGGICKSQDEVMIV